MWRKSHTAGLSPARVVQDRSGRFVTVLFSSSLGAIDSLVKPDLIAFTILDITKKPTLDTFRLRNGRDVTFIDIQANQTQETETYKVLVINAEGTAIYALAGRP